MSLDRYWVAFLLLVGCARRPEPAGHDAGALVDAGLPPSPSARAPREVRLTGLTARDLSGIDVPPVVTHLSVDQNPALEHTRGLASLQEVVFQLDFWRNPSLVAIDGFDAVVFHGSLLVLGHPKLTTLGVLRGVPAGHGGLRLEVRENPLLTSLGGLRLEGPVANGLLLEDDPRLVDVSALTSVTGCNLLRIKRTGLTDLHGLEHLANATVPATSVTLEDNPELVDLSALSGLEALSGLRVANNPKLTSLRGLEHVKVLTFTSLRLRDNASLRDVSALLAIPRFVYLPPDDSSAPAPPLDLGGNPLLPAPQDAALRRRVREATSRSR